MIIDNHTFGFGEREFLKNQFFVMHNKICVKKQIARHMYFLAPENDGPTQAIISDNANKLVAIIPIKLIISKIIVSPGIRLTIGCPILHPIVIPIRPTTTDQNDIISKVFVGHLYVILELK